MDPDEDVLRRAAAVAARVLTELWPDGRTVAGIEEVGSTQFVVSSQRDGVRVRRTAEVAGRVLEDVIDLGLSEPFELPAGARLRPDGTVSVELPMRRFRGRPRPRRWTEEEIERLSRRLNAIDTVVLGIGETFCRVCGFDDPLESERYFVGEPQYVICVCCGSESGPDDLTPELVRPIRRASVEAGRTWHDPAERPADWVPDAALTALPTRWRDL